jgi:hypothetical protein
VEDALRGSVNRSAHVVGGGMSLPHLTSGSQRENMQGMVLRRRAEADPAAKRAWLSAEGGLLRLRAAVRHG